MGRDMLSSPSTPSVTWILGVDQLPAHIDADRPALLWGRHRRTYGELRERALRLAAGLRGLGCKPGDRVGSFLLNRGEIFELYFACAYAGVTLVPVSFRFNTSELAYIARDAEIRVLLTQENLADVALGGIRASTDVKVIVLADDEPGPEYESLADGPALEPPYPATDPHVALYTSGTTGVPKGVKVDHHSTLWFAMQQAVFYPGWDSSMVNLLNAPLNGPALNEQSVPAFLVGATVAIVPSRGWSPQGFAALVDRYSATHAVIFPSMMKQLLEADREEAIALRSLRFVLTGGENCPTPTMAGFRQRWRQISLYVAYGMTEGGLCTLIRDDEIEEHPGSVGRPFLLQRVRVVDEHGATVPTGAIGEVWTAGASVSSGILGSPEVTADVLHDGWLATGDLGRFDEEGYLYIEGRKKDMIISSSQNIYPAEIENVLSTHEGLLDWTVIGVPDEERGEAVCALVVPRPGFELTAEDVVGHVTAHLASYKKPKHVVFVEQLPRNPMGKVLKNELRASWAQKLPA
jgi:fatty-acyl-CoA synthase